MSRSRTQTTKTHGNGFHALVRQCFGGGLASVARDAADFELARQLLVGEEMSNYRTALISGCAKDGDNLRHGWLLGREMVFLRRLNVLGVVLLCLDAILG